MKVRLTKARGTKAGTTHGTTGPADTVETTTTLHQNRPRPAAEMNDAVAESERMDAAPFDVIKTTMTTTKNPDP
jgi:hypothetical protein